MAFPWAGFSTFKFTLEESPLFGTDVGWVLSPSYDRGRPLGTRTDSIVTTAIGSADRSFEVNLSPARLAQLEALINTGGQFCGWDRPVPDARQAFLANVTPQEFYPVRCSDGTTAKRIRTRLEFVSL